MNTILILHGWGMGSKSWSKAREIMENQGYRVFVPDFPGFGVTIEPVQPWSVGDYVDWVKDFCEKNNLSQFFILGHSFGGRIAVEFAARYPEKLKALILVGAAVVVREKTLGLRQKIILKLAKLKHLIVCLPFLGELSYPFLQRLSYFLAGTRDYYLIKSPVMKETFKRVITEDLTASLDKITAPSLVVWGEKDKIIPVKFAYPIKEKIPNSILEILPGIGHNPHLEAPEILAEKIIKFIND